MADLVVFLKARLDEAEQYTDPEVDLPDQLLPYIGAMRALLAEIESELADDPTVEMPQDRLRILAAVYRDHPDYQQDWGPSGG